MNGQTAIKYLKCATNYLMWETDATNKEEEEKKGIAFVILSN